MNRSSRRLVSDINVVPYIDVMLVLLVIFMVTAPLLNQGVEIDLPEAPAEPIDGDGPEPIVISVDASGHIFLNINVDPNVSLLADELVYRVKAALEQTADRPVMIRGDANSPYENIVSVLVLLQRAEVNRVGLITNPEAIKSIQRQ